MLFTKLYCGRCAKVTFHHVKTADVKELKSGNVVFEMLCVEHNAPELLENWVSYIKIELTIAEFRNLNFKTCNHIPK